LQLAKQSVSVKSETWTRIVYGSNLETLKWLSSLRFFRRFFHSVEATLQEPKQRRSKSFRIYEALCVIRCHTAWYRQWRLISHTKMTSSLLPWIFLNSTSDSEINNTANVVINAKWRQFQLAVFGVGKQKLFHNVTVCL
jgi:hypothetical protein